VVGGLRYFSNVAGHWAFQVRGEIGIVKSFLVVQSELDSRVRGHLFGYFERVGDDALPTTVQILRDTMKDGKRYGDLERRMENLEGLVPKLVANRTVKNHPVNIERLLQRAADAKAAVQLSDVLSFFLIATPAEPVKLNGSFSTKSAEYKAIVEPPAYCEQEFDVNPHNPVQHLHGELGYRTGRSK
jgi:hypothetical protein